MSTQSNEAMARALIKAIDFAEWGWTIIANAHGGSWELESKDWREVAAKYRDQFHNEIRFLAGVSRAESRASIADERQISDGLGKLNDDLRAQLLAAQVAIGKVKEELSQEKSLAKTMNNVWDVLRNINLSLLHAHDAEILNEIVRLLGSIFLSNGRSLLGGSPPPFWSAHLIAQVAAENIKRNDAEVRKPLVEALQKAKPIVGAAVAASSNESRPLREKVYNQIDAALAQVGEKPK